MHVAFLLFLVCSFTCSTVCAALRESDVFFERAINLEFGNPERVSGGSPFVVFRLKGRQSRKAEEVCTTIGFLGRAVSVEYGIAFDRDGIISIRKILRDKVGKVIMFGKKESEASLGLDHTFREFVAARVALKTLSTSELVRIFVDRKPDSRERSVFQSYIVKMEKQPKLLAHVLVDRGVAVGFESRNVYVVAVRGLRR